MDLPFMIILLPDEGLPIAFFVLDFLPHRYETDFAFLKRFGRRVGCKYRMLPPSMDSL